MLQLAVAALIFTGGHFLFSSTPLRAWAVDVLGGEARFQLVFSLAMSLALIWLVLAYAAAPFAPLWLPPPWSAWLALILMPFAAILLVASLRPDNPTALTGHPEALQPERIGFFAVTRHPMLWGFTLWSAGHLAANGDAASMLLFGAFFLLALPGTFAIDAKLKRVNVEGWRRLSRYTSNIPLAALLAGRTRLSIRAVLWPVGGGLALFLALLWGHRWLFGVSPLPPGLG